MLIIIAIIGSKKLIIMTTLVIINMVMQFAMVVITKIKVTLKGAMVIFIKTEIIGKIINYLLILLINWTIRNNYSINNPNPRVNYFMKEVDYFIKGTII